MDPSQYIIAQKELPVLQRNPSFEHFSNCAFEETVIDDADVTS